MPQLKLPTALCGYQNTPEKCQKINIDSLKDSGITCSYSPMNSIVTVWKATNAFRVSVSNIGWVFKNELMYKPIFWLQIFKILLWDMKNDTAKQWSFLVQELVENIIWLIKS